MKNLVIVFCLISLISFTAVIKNSSKKIEEEIFILNESLSLLEEKYDLVSFEYTFLSSPSRLIGIMRDDKNEEYNHLNAMELKTFYQVTLTFKE